MEDNPYAVLANILTQSNNSQFVIYQGKVIKVSPLTIKTAGLLLSGNELMVNSMLLRQKVTITNISGNLAAQEHLSIAGGELAAELTPDFQVGDTVLLLTTDQQLFYVLCKVVSV
nr:MAG: hypothetical protein DIU64_10940 [Caldicoprobacter oshimai]